MDQRPITPEESLSLAIEYVTGTKSGRNDGLSLDQLVELVGSELKLPKGEESQRFRDILGMLKDFAARKDVKRPLSIAVFGPPGSGKSRGVKSLLKEIGGCRPAVEVNLSQVDDGGILTETMAREIAEANREQSEEAKKQGAAENSPDWPQRKTIVFIFDEFELVSKYGTARVAPLVLVAHAGRPSLAQWRAASHREMRLGLYRRYCGNVRRVRDTSETG